MKIRKLELKNFGKFKEKELCLEEGLHIIYGENESGKSTLHTFIKSMLFGLERGRGRAAVCDTFSRYEPWENPAYYAGALVFECGGKRFRLERDFGKTTKKAVLFCEDDGEELSVKDGDLEMLLSGLTAANYEDTLYVGQLRAKTSQALAAELKNYATNYYVTGDSDIDLVAAVEALKEKKKSIDREVKISLQERQYKRERIEQEASYVWRDIHSLEAEIQEAEERLKGREEEKESGQKHKRVIDEIRPARWRIHPIEVIILVAMVIAAFLLPAQPWNFLVSIILALASGIYVWNRLKEGKKKNENGPEASLYGDASEEEYVTKERLVWEKEHLQGELKERMIQYENLKEQLEDMDELGREYQDQDQTRAAIMLALSRLEEVSGDMQEQLSREVNQRASEIMAELTGGKYTRLFIDEDLHMSLLAVGRKVQMEQVSQGTLEQIYFAFRMAVSEILHEEAYPIILDDTFAFYDDGRLMRTLQWLARNGRQVILFTCQTREEALLKKAGIPYSKTVLN